VKCACVAMKCNVWMRVCMVSLLERSNKEGIWKNLGWRLTDNYVIVKDKLERLVQTVRWRSSRMASITLG
jgi:hypothetical protein